MRIRLSLCGQIAALSRPAGEQVRYPKRRGHVNRLRHLVSIDEATQHDWGALIDRAHRFSPGPRLLLLRAYASALQPSIPPPTTPTAERLPGCAATQSGSEAALSARRDLGLGRWLRTRSLSARYGGAVRSMARVRRRSPRPA